MQFVHEQLDVYRLSIRYVAWASKTAKPLQGKTMLLRSVALLTKIGQGNDGVREDSGGCDSLDYDNDNDNDVKGVA